MPPRLFCPDLPNPRLPDQRCVLDPHQTRHARKVLRLSAGSAVCLLDGQGTCAQAQILGFEQGHALCQVIGRETVDRLTPTITIATCIPKGPRADDLIDQLSQLGVDEVIPLRTDRSVVDPGGGKLEKFERRAQEASKQCGRLYLMTIREPLTLDAALHEQADVKLILSPAADRQRQAGDHLAQRLKQAQRALALVGPEGGFTDNELACATTAGFERWALAGPTLRIETAALATATLLRHAP